MLFAGGAGAAAPGEQPAQNISDAVAHFKQTAADAVSAYLKRVTWLAGTLKTPVLQRAVSFQHLRIAVAYLTAYLLGLCAYSKRYKCNPPICLQ